MGRLRKLIPRYSLRTLIVFLLLVTSGVGLWWHWEPWCLEHILRLEQAKVFSVEFSPDGGRAVVAAVGGSASVWDTASGRELFDLAGYEGTCYVGAFTEDGSIIFASGIDELQVWDARSGERLVTLEGRCEHASRALGRCLMQEGVDTFSIYDMSSGERLSSIALGPDGYAGACLSPKGRLINVTGKGGKEHRVLDAATGKRVFALTRVFCALISPDESLLAWSDGDSRVQLFSLPDGRMLWEHSEGPGIQFFPQGDRIVTFDDDHVARVRRASDGTCLASLAGHPEGLVTGWVSPDGERVVTYGNDAVRRWDSATGELLGVATGQYAALSPDFRTVVTQEVSLGNLTIWGGHNWTDSAELEGGPWKPGGIRISCDGTRCTMIRVDGGADIWRLRRPPRWWGVFWLWEFWLTAVFAGLFVWSVVRDRRALAPAQGPGIPAGKGTT